MRFKNYEWKQEPKTLERQDDKIFGYGEIIGDGASEEFQKMMKTFYEPGSGALDCKVHGWRNIGKMEWVCLRLLEPATDNHVHYEMCFFPVV